MKDKKRVRGEAVMEMPDGWRAGFESAQPRRVFGYFLAAQKVSPPRRAEKNIKNKPIMDKKMVNCISENLWLHFPKKIGSSSKKT
jgi:hypothetical protein